MRARLRLVIATVLVCFVTTSVWADYLIVSRPATLKAEAVGDADIRQHLEAGDRLVLLDSAQTRGYYHAHDSQTGVAGYVYRTFVRRYHGAEPTAPPSPVDPSALQTLPLTGDFFQTAEPCMFIHVINIGQGAALLLEFPCGAVMIDAGAYGSADKSHLLDYLNQFFEAREDLDRTIDALFITHNHDDHTKALLDVFEQFKIKNYIDNGEKEGGNQAKVRAYIASMAVKPKTEEITDRDFTGAHYGKGLKDGIIDPINCPGVDPTIQVLSGRFESKPSGWTATSYNNENNQSIVIRVDFGESSLLVTGDLMREGQALLIDAYHSSPLLDVDIYEAGHHGADNGTTPELVSAVTPDLALISMGDPDYKQRGKTAWDYGHPRIETVRLLDSAITGKRSPAIDVKVATGSKKFQAMRVEKRIYATGWDGDVVIKANMNGEVAVATSKAAKVP